MRERVNHAEVSPRAEHVHREVIKTTGELRSVFLVPFSGLPISQVSHPVPYVQWGSTVFWLAPLSVKSVGKECTRRRQRREEEGGDEEEDATLLTRA